MTSGKLLRFSAFLFLCGCVGARSAPRVASPKPAAKSRIAPTLSQRDVLLQTAEAAWSQRSREDALKEAIDSWQQALEIDKSDPETWVRLSRALVLWAEFRLTQASGCPQGGAGAAFLPSVAQDGAGTEKPNTADSEAPLAGDAEVGLGNAGCEFDTTQATVPGRSKASDLVLQILDRATQAAEGALDAMMPASQQPASQDGSHVKELSDLGKQAVPALYWKARSLNLRSSLAGYVERIANQDTVLELMAHCLREDPAYFYGGPHRFFGTHYARPLYFGDRDLAKSRRHFERAVQIAPEFLATYVAYAGDYAVMAQDRQTFEKQLAYVMATDPGGIPETAPENQLQKRRAEQLLRLASDLFD